MTQPTMSNIIHEVAEAIIVLGRRRKLVDFALTPAAKVELKAGFARRGTIPGGLACVDGTLVAIQEPEDLSIADMASFMTRKGYYALNVMVVKDDDSGEAPSDPRQDAAELPQVPLSHDIYLKGRQQRNSLVSLFQCVRGVLGDSAPPAPQDWPHYSVWIAPPEVLKGP
ncbi:hypothetical protein MTO96_046225 [Rhipicephalus appendiculatus]